MVIATWDDVGHYNSSTDLTNTFQAVLATDGTSSFVMFLYSEIQWTIPDPKPPASYSVRYKIYTACSTVVWLQHEHDHNNLSA